MLTEEQIEAVLDALPQELRVSDMIILVGSLLGTYNLLGPSTYLSFITHLNIAVIEKNKMDQKYDA